jgi:hypothetical protein
VPTVVYRLSIILFHDGTYVLGTYSTRKKAEEAKASYERTHPENVMNGLLDIDDQKLDYSFWEWEIP